MNIRKAVIGDLPQITSVYAYARELMKNTGNATQWKTTYPTEDIIRSDIESGYLHLLCDEDGIEGVFAFLPEGDPVYLYLQIPHPSDPLKTQVLLPECF